MVQGFHKGDGGPASPPYSQGPYQTEETMIFNKPAVDSFMRYTLNENFMRLPQANGSIDAAYTGEAVRICNRDFETAGTGVSDDDVTFGAEIAGILLTTDSSGSQQVIIVPHQDTGYSAWLTILWGTENQVIWEAVIRTGASVASIVLCAGLRESSVVDISGDDDAAFFRFDAGVANWEATTSIDGTDVEFDTDVVVAANTNYYFRIEIDADRKPHFFINNAEVYTGGAMTNDIDLYPVIGVEGNAKTMYIVKQKISRIIYE